MNQRRFFSVGIDDEFRSRKFVSDESAERETLVISQRAGERPAFEAPGVRREERVERGVCEEVRQVVAGRQADEKIVGVGVASFKIRRGVVDAVDLINEAERVAELLLEKG